MTPVLYLGIMLFMKFLQSIFNKKTSNTLKDWRGYVFLGAFQYITAAVIALVLIFIGGKGLSLDAPTVLISLLAAVSLCVCTFCPLAAMKDGSLTLVSLFGTAGLLVPSIAGVFLFGEKMSLMQYVGIAVFLVSAWLLIGASKEIYKSFSFKTFLLLMGSLLGNGTVMLTQKLFVYKVPGGDVSSFSFLIFGSLGLILSAVLPFTLSGGKQKRGVFTPRLAAYGAVMALAVLVLNQLSTLIADSVPSVVLFSVVNGGGIIITAIVAAVMFGEKLTVKSAAGIIIGLASLITINIF
ncbi:MAG: EamA family transporter [Eubacteriales bacterium]